MADVLIISDFQFDSPLNKTKRNYNKRTGKRKHVFMAYK